MAEGLLLPGDEHPLAQKVRDAIGVGTYQEVRVVTPQFEREDGQTFSFRPDKTPEFFDQLAKAPDDILESIGMRRWDETMMMFPSEWYDYIPEGYVVTDINGQDEPFKHGQTDDDIRGGCLAYGFRRQEPPHDRPAR